MVKQIEGWKVFVISEDTYDEQDLLGGKLVSASIPKHTLKITYDSEEVLRAELRHYDVMVTNRGKTIVDFISWLDEVQRNEKER